MVPTAMRRLLLPALALLLLSVAFGGEAQAYPQFQFSSGTNRCSHLLGARRER